MFDWDSQKDFLHVDATVERCTSDMLFQPDYEQNIKLVDKLNAKPKLIDTYLEAIKRRMTNPSEEIVLQLCVSLLETILKNCPGAVEAWGKREYQEAVVRTVVTTKYLRARESLLELIQLLGISYKDDKQLNYGLAYTELINRHRISFPPFSGELFVAPSVPVAHEHKPNESQSLHRSARRSSEIDPLDPWGMDGLEMESQYEAVNTHPKSKGKVASIEDQLDAASSSLGLLNEILDNLSPGDSISGNEILASVLPTVQTLHENIVRILQGESANLSEGLLERLLSANDAISEALKKYEDAKKGKIRAKRTSPVVPVAPAKPPAPVNDFFRDEPTAPTFGIMTSKLATKNVADEFDEFAMLAKRKRPTSASNPFDGMAPTQNQSTQNQPSIQNQSSITNSPAKTNIIDPMILQPTILQPTVLQPTQPTQPSNTSNPNSGNGSFI